MALIKPISNVMSGTVTEITPTNVNTGNSFEFTLPNVVIGSKLVIVLMLHNASSSPITSITTSDGTIDVNLDIGNNATKTLIITPSAPSVTVTGSKPNTNVFDLLKCYMIA